MFRPLTMKQLRIQLLSDDLPQAALTLAETGAFSPGDCDDYAESFPDVPGEHYRELYHQARSRLDKIGNHIRLDPPSGIPLRMVSETELAETNNWLGEVWERCSSYEEQSRALTD